MDEAEQEKDNKKNAPCEKKPKEYWARQQEYTHNALNESIQTANETGVFTLKILITLSSTFLIGYFYASDGLRSDIINGLPYLFYSFVFAMLTLISNYFSYLLIVPIWEKHYEKACKSEEPDENTITVKRQNCFKNAAIICGVLTGLFLLIGLTLIFKSVSGWSWCQILTFGLL